MQRPEQTRLRLELVFSPANAARAAELAARENGCCSFFTFALRSGQVAEQAGVNLQTLRERAQEKIAEVDARIADLTTIRRALSAVVSAGCDSLTHCTCPDCPLPFADLAASRAPEEK